MKRTTPLRTVGRKPKKSPTATAKCQCPYHLLEEGTTVDVFSLPTDNSKHGREVMRLLLLQHAEATLSQDWHTTAVLSHGLMLLATLLIREASRNILAEAV